MRPSFDLQRQITSPFGIKSRRRQQRRLGIQITFRAQSSLRTWIFRIVVNQARNRQRWWRRRRRDAQVPIEDHIRNYGEFRTTSASDPARALAQKELAARLSRALSQLPFEQRTVIVLREVDGLSYDEIAEAAGLNVGTVKSRLARARESLRGALRDA